MEPDQSNLQGLCESRWNDFWQAHIINTLSQFGITDPLISKCIWAAAWQNQRNEYCALRRLGSAGHLPSLIRVFAVRMKKHWAPNYLSEDWSDWVDARLIWVFEMSFAPCEDSDQPGHPPSLIRVFVVRMKKHWAPNYLLSTQWRLIRLGWCPGWSESSLGAYVVLLVLSWGGSFGSAHMNKVLIT